MCPCRVFHPGKTCCFVALIEPLTVVFRDGSSVVRSSNPLILVDIIALLAADRKRWVRFDDTFVQLAARKHNWSSNLELFNLRCVVCDSRRTTMLLDYVFLDPAASMRPWKSSRSDNSRPRTQQLRWSSETTTKRHL